MAGLGRGGLDRQGAQGKVRAGGQTGELRGEHRRGLRAGLREYGQRPEGGVFGLVQHADREPFRELLTGLSGVGRPGALRPQRAGQVPEPPPQGCGLPDVARVRGLLSGPQGQDLLQRREQVGHRQPGISEHRGIQVWRDLADEPGDPRYWQAPVRARAAFMACSSWLGVAVLRLRPLRMCWV